MKNTKVVQWVTTPTRKRLATTRKRTLRSRKLTSCSPTVMTARSVWSDHQSHVIEPRKLGNCWGLSAQWRKGNITLCTERPKQKPRQAKCSETRSGSESRAEMYWDSLGTWESLCSPLKKTRNVDDPRYQSPGIHEQRCLMDSPRKTANERKPQTSRRRGSGNRDTGSLSSPIVAIENRETSPGGSL